MTRVMDRTHMRAWRADGAADADVPLTVQRSENSLETACKKCGCSQSCFRFACLCLKRAKVPPTTLPSRTISR